MSIVAEGKMVQDVSGVALNVVTGQAWELSETAITATKDIIVKKGGKVVSHVQVKDTVNCINKTIQKASIGECVFFASLFWRKLQNIFGENCISILAKVAAASPEPS